MRSKMLSIGLCLVIALIAWILQAMFGNRRSKKQKTMEEAGSTVAKMPGGSSYVLLALGIFAFVFVNIFVFIFLTVAPSEALDEAGGMMMVCEGLGIFILLVCILGFYSIRASMIAFDGEKITVCKAFRANQEIPWGNIGSIDMRDSLCILYDRNGKVLLRVSAQVDNYARFCETAKAKVVSQGGRVMRQ